MLNLPECPKEKCFYWICPGGAADMSGKTYATVEDAFKKGKWQSFPDGGCSCLKKCSRLHEDGEGDYYEPC